MVSGHYIEGKRKRLYFRTKQEAEIELARIKTIKASEGESGTTLSVIERGDCVRALDVLKPYGVSLHEAASFYASHLQQIHRSLPMNELLPQYLDYRERAGLSERAKRDARLRLNRFASDFGNANVATIASRQIEDWLHGLGQAPQSMNNYRAVLSAFFAFAIKRGYASENPIIKVDKMKLVEKPPGILTPDQLCTLLDLTTTELLPVLVIGAFAGIRMAEIHRLEWKDIDLQRGFIHVGADKSKTAKRRLVKIEPVLASWLASYSDRAGKVWEHTEGYWWVNMREILAEAKLTDWPDNALRHSYASYWLAKYQNANELALYMGHTTTAVIFQHYRELVTPDEADRYWKLFPIKK